MVNHKQDKEFAGWKSMEEDSDLSKEHTLEILAFVFDSGPKQKPHFFGHSQFQEERGIEVSQSDDSLYKKLCYCQKLLQLYEDSLKNSEIFQNIHL